MAINSTAIDKYAYYIKGGKIGLVKWDDGENRWVTPNKTVSEGLYFTYSELPTILLDEDSELPVNDSLAEALIYYVKALLAEDGANMEIREYYMRLFRRKVGRYSNNKVSGLKRISSGGWGIR